MQSASRVKGTANLPKMSPLRGEAIRGVEGQVFTVKTLEGPHDLLKELVDAFDVLVECGDVFSNGGLGGRASEVGVDIFALFRLWLGSGREVSGHGLKLRGRVDLESRWGEG